MKSSLKVKLLQHLAAKKSGNAGFTLIELLVVIIIIGILSAIALPSFLNQANKAKQSEAKTYVGSMNRAQQAYYLEKGTFSAIGVANVADNDAAIGALGLGIQTDTEYYSYAITAGDAGTAPNTFKAVTNGAQPLSDSLKAYLGGVQIGTQAGTGEATTLASLCEAVKAPVQTGAAGTEVFAFTFNAAGGDGAPVCPNLNADPAGYTPVN